MALRGSLYKKVQDIRQARKKTDIAKSVYKNEYQKALIVERVKAAKKAGADRARAEAVKEAEKARARYSEGGGFRRAGQEAYRAFDLAGQASSNLLGVKSKPLPRRFNLKPKKKRIRKIRRGGQTIRVVYVQGGKPAKYIRKKRRPRQNNAMNTLIG